ncbi:MAG: YcgL domain-containing protein [Pseudomonadota bacterium]
MQCFVYKSRKQEDMYIYLAEKDNFECLPDPLKEKFGEPVFTLEFTFTPERKLAKEDPQTVLQNLAEHGFHLQMPEEVRLDGPIDSRYH